MRTRLDSFYEVYFLTWENCNYLRGNELTWKMLSISKGSLVLYAIIQPSFKCFTPVVGNFGRCLIWGSKLGQLWQPPTSSYSVFWRAWLAVGGMGWLVQGPRILLTLEQGGGYGCWSQPSRKSAHNFWFPKNLTCPSKSSGDKFQGSIATKIHRCSSLQL